MYKLDGTLVQTIIREDAQIVPLITKDSYAKGFRPRDNGYAVRLIPEWGVRVSFKMDNGVYSWSAQAVGDSNEWTRVVRGISQTAQTYATQEEVLSASYDALAEILTMG